MDLLSRYRAQIEAVVGATAIVSPTRYAWFGVRSPALPRHVRRAMTPATARGVLLYQLQAQLYRDFYCAGGAGRPPLLPPPPGLAGLTPFVARLQAANAGAGYWDPDWQVLSVVEAGVMAGQRALALWVPDGAGAVAADAAVPGAAVRLWFPKDLLGSSPGFYMAVSDTPLPPAAPLVRCYWHVTAEGAEPLLALVTRQLNAAGLPFKLKVVNDPRHFTRCDAAVLYIRQEDYAGVAPILARIYPALAGSLRPGIPALTRPLAPGLGLAEDPGGGESFGLHRCLLLAEGLLAAYEAGATTLTARVQSVVDHLAAAGVALATPFLRPGAADDYAFRLPAGVVRSPAAQTRSASPDPDLPAAARVTADQIGQQIVQAAVWHDDQCNWVGAALPDAPSLQQGRTVYHALGPDLYAGTSGVGLFLAELYAVTGDPEVGRTAAGALRQALAHAGRVPPPERVAFYSGWVGLAFAAVRGGLLLKEEALITQAGDLLQRLAAEETAAAHDLLSGRAGAISGLLALDAVLGEAAQRRFAVQLGQELIAAAAITARGYSWAAPGRKDRHHLTGFSHGAAGIGYALLELFNMTGAAAYRTAGEGAYAYEQSWFDPVTGNWPDFRGDQAGGGRQPARAFAVAWCHGAPGIGLARLRAYELLGAEHYAQAAAHALQTTRQAIRQALTVPRHDFSLCHGLAGHAEVLRQAAPILPHEASSNVDSVNEVAHQGIAGYSGPQRPWPCGVGNGETPGLMLGWAGIGLFYLRLCNDKIPSILAPHGSVWDA